MSEQKQRVVTPEEFQGFIQTNLSNALRLIQEAQVALDQMVIHLNNRGATDHLPTKEEVLAQRREELFREGKFGPDENAGDKGVKGIGPCPPGVPGPTEEVEPSFAQAALAEPELSTDDKRETVITTLMNVMGRTREEAEALVEAAKNGKLINAKRQAAELLIPTDEWLPLFQGRTSVFADFLSGEIYEGGRGPVAPKFTSSTGFVFKQYTEDLTQIRGPGLAAWPTGFYRNTSRAVQENQNNLQFKLNLDGGDFIILEDMHSLPSFVEAVGPYANAPQRLSTLSFPTLRELYDRIQKALWALLK